MYYSLVAMALMSAALTGLVTWGIARRYGRRRALLVPLVALGAILFLLWRTDITGDQDAMLFLAFAVTQAGSSVGGALLGLLLSGRRRR